MGVDGWVGGCGSGWVCVCVGGGGSGCLWCGIPGKFLLSFKCHKLHTYISPRVVQFEVRPKVWVRKLSRILTNLKSAVRSLVKVRQT